MPDRRSRALFAASTSPLSVCCRKTRSSTWWLRLRLPVTRRVHKGGRSVVVSQSQSSWCKSDARRKSPARRPHPYL